MRSAGCILSSIVAVMLFAGMPAHAQLSTATMTGRITAGGAPAQAGLEVTATNTANGFVYRTATRSDGSYVLPGLAPGRYDIRVAGEQLGEPITLSVGERASVDLSTGAAVEGEPLQEVMVVGSTYRKDVLTSEVATNVSEALIESLPQDSRNFLAFADLAPGVRFNVSQNTGNVRISGGAQNDDNVNVFIDGVGQKNYILKGGVSGMDSSRGNPFPQSAVAEYKVISQNYKAEYDQVSSVAITAVTRSGTNEWTGDLFWDRLADSWVAESPFEKAAEAQGVERPEFEQDQFGLTLGGPIVLDRMHFFVAYEGKRIEEPRQVVLQAANLLPNAGVVPELMALQGNQKTEFEEDLILGKVDAQLTDDQRIEFTARFREESDFVPEDTLISTAENVKDRVNDETRLDFKHEWRINDWLNEARTGYQEATWNPHSASSNPFTRYFVSPTNNPNDVQRVLFTGGSPDAQHREQRGFYVQNDLTFAGRENHTFKGGLKVNFMTFDLSGTAFSVPRVDLLIDNMTGQTSVIRTQPALAPAGAEFDDEQFGIYFQDDWRVNDRLELNLGIRWDYETNMLNDDFVTPADRIAALFGPDTRNINGITAPPGQTYAQSIALGGINISEFIADGSSREAFKEAFQPRFGFSYDLTGDRNTVVFGGAGRAYDRTNANHALDELQKNAQPNGEIWLIKNDHKMPYTDQYSLGLRQGLGAWNTEIGGIYARGHNQFNWYGGNRDPNGGFAQQSPIDPLFGGPAGFGTLILGDFITETRTASVYLQGEKPLANGWNLIATYTFTDGETTHRNWNQDIFNWTFSKPGQGSFNDSVTVEEHRLVVAGLTNRLPLGLTFSGRGVVGSGLPYQITDCSGGFPTPTTPGSCLYHKGDGSTFKQVDMALSRSFEVFASQVTLRADVLNVFNWRNYGGFEGFAGGPGNPPQNEFGGSNPNLGRPTSISGPMRTLKLSLRASF